MTDPTPDVPTLRRLLAEATPGPWEVSDWWHIQGAKWCRCDSGPLVWSGKRDINGTRMEAHVHRRGEPIGSDIMQSDASDGDPANVSFGSDYGPGVGDDDAALIAAAVNALPGILDRLEAAEGAVARVEVLADELAHPDTDLIVAFERAIHRNIARDLRAALAEVTL